MAYVFLFPDLGEGLTEGKLLQWYVQEGALVKEGDLIAKIETDKVVADIPVPRSGRVLKLHGRLDDIILVGNPLIELEPEGPSPLNASASEMPAGGVGESGPGVVGNIEVATGPEVMPVGDEGRTPATQAEVGTGGRAAATPVARRMAMDLRLDINQVPGTGPQGRVMKADILRAGAVPKDAGSDAAPARPIPGPAATPAHPQGSTRVEPLSQLRKAVAARMVQSKFSAPHATTFEEVEVSRLVELRASQRDRYQAEGLRLSYMPFICRAVALALRHHPRLNCRLDMEAGTVSYHEFVNLGLAVDTPEGLIVPVIGDADRLSIRELALRIADLAERARNRQIRLEELRGGTFTITNYGAIAGIFGAPIINAPESAILGIGRLLETPIVRDGQVVPGQVLPLSLAVDHRIIDGGDASRFLRELMELLANPLGMLMD